MGNISRRDFLRGAAGVALSGTLMGLTRGAAFAESGSGGEIIRENTSTKKQNIHYHESDVLVIGGGIAGMEAALTVCQAGKSAIIVDKGVFGHSGTSGMNWGHTYQSMEFSPDDDETIANTLMIMDMVCEGLLNQTYFYSLLKAQKEEKVIANGLKYGSIPLYNEDGTVLSHNGPTEGFPVTHDQGFWPRMMAQWCQRNSNVTEICDQMFVVDILTAEDGSAAGAVAIDRVNGDPHVFRAKSTIMASGGYCWITGWNGMGAESMAAKEETGDGTAMLLRHQVPMADMEQYCGDASQWTPAGTRQTMGNLNFDASQTPYDMIYDGNMVPWSEMTAEVRQQVMSINMGNTAKIMYGLRLHGRATEHGGCYMDKDCAPVMPRYFRRSEEREKKFLGYDMPQYIEVVPETWASAGAPRNLSMTSETDIPRLFFAGPGPGGLGGMTQIAAQTGGYVAAKGALALNDEVQMPAPAKGQIDAILQKAYEIFDRNPSDPIRPREVMHKIQTTYWDRELGPLKDEKKILEIIKELTRIQEEDLPRMAMMDKSFRMNGEWQDAFEAENMLYCALAASYAGLERRETRGYNLRTDYPNTDNSYGLANTVTTLGQDGEWKTEMADKIDTIIGRDTVAYLVPECIGLDTFAE